MPDLRPFKEQYPELYRISRDIASSTCREINEQAANVKSKAKYKAQGILEEIIKMLKESV